MTKKVLIIGASGSLATVVTEELKKQAQYSHHTQRIL